MTQATGTIEPGLAEPGERLLPDGRRSVRLIARSLFLLTKPRIIELLLVTTLPTMLLAQRGLPSAWLILVTLLGGALAAASANTLNCYIDRDIDAIMKRTSQRPLVAGRAGHGASGHGASGQGASGHGASGHGASGQAVSGTAVKPGEALASGILLGAAATLLLGLAANWLAAALADAAILFYVFIYTIALKRRTASNIVIGGAAGCFPVLVGWAAVTGRVSWAAGVLFAVIFFWTPPHFWALAIKFRDDYAAAKVPMLPVVATPAAVAKKILLYSYAMVAATLLLTPYAGWVYGCCAAVLGGWFLAEAHRLRRRIETAGGSAPMRLFHLSIVYLTLLFAAVALTVLLPWHGW
ncbi:MAG TPA: heme o synthase [Streptosporangiaceae bacterium]|nr:heme o synthase [Streptosporangiaceae bacterium]